MLSTVIDSMIAFDTSTPINCQVSSVFHVWPVILSQSVWSTMFPFSKIWVTAGLVSAFFYLHMPAPIAVSRSLVTSLLLLRRC
jgi:hypothetical protein